MAWANTHTASLCDEVLISFFVLLQVLLSSWRSERKYSLISQAALHFNCVWLRTCGRLESIRSLLICCRIQQKIHETHKINFARDLSTWGVRIRNLLICYRILQKIHETHKLWHPSEQNYLFVQFIRVCNNSRGCAKILEILEGTGWWVNFGGRFWSIFYQPFCGGGM